MLLKKIKENFFNERFLKFCVTGVLNTFNSALYSWIFHLFLQENLAAVIGYAISLSINFYINSTFIFKRKRNFRAYFRFIISYVPNFIIYSLVTFLTINVFNLPQFWGTVLAAVTGGPITFLIIKFYVFGKRNKM